MEDLTRTEVRPEPEGPTTAAPARPSGPPRWTGGRITMIVLGSVLAIIGVGILACGAYGLWLDTTQRSDGYVMTSSERFTTNSHALATNTLRISSDVPGFLYGRDWLGDVRIRGASTDPARPIFLGIARKNDVDRYLAGVAHAQVVDVNGNPFGTTYRPTYVERPGTRPATAPGRAKIWVASVEGRGARALTWSVKPGRWAVVLMRPDGSRGVSADLAAGAKLPALLWVSIVLFVAGLLTLGGAAALIYLGAREPRAPGPPAA